MAQTVLLSVALLSVVLSFHGALGISGCRVTQTGLENYCLSTKDYWAQSLQGPIQQLPVPALPGLAGCRFDVLTCERVSVVFRPPYGVDVVVCFVVQIKCSLLLTVRIAFCATIRLAVVPLGLSFGSCSSEYVEVKVDPLINLQLPVVAQILAPVLDPVVCSHAPKMITQLNIVLNLQLQPTPFFTGCQYICTRPYPPQLTSGYLDFPFVPQMSCGGAVVPWPNYPIYYPPATLVPDGHICYFLNEADTGHIFSTLMARELFNLELTQSTVTTTLIMSRIPEIDCPADLSSLLKFSCTSLSIQFTANAVILDAELRINIGYFQSEFVGLLQATARVRIILRPAIDCQRGLLLLSADLISNLQITAACSGSPCTVDGSVIEELFPIRTHCQDLFNERLRGGIPWPFPINCACSSCRDVIVIPKFAMWCCNLNYLP
ncbi:Hypothetical predicted protein [Podarcis lilfordi]|uniref:Uncharacterized protein n=1 Tax=Podarcis lilfordi TaxID=74358 RepID=A0AA35PAB0_9SAUR|nr:Hypothetical predicted protein [Podarcis lilfordi]